MTPIVVAIAAGLAIAGSPASATDGSYRSVMPDGRVHYGEAPAAGAKQVRKLAPPPISTGTVVVTEEEKRQARRVLQEKGARVVLSPAPRESPEAAKRGRLQAPATLPKPSSYY